MMLKNTIFIFILLVILLQFLLPATAQPNGDNRDDGGRYRGQNYSEQNFRPSMTVTIIVLAVACVFIAFISFYIRRCSHNIHIQGGSIRLAARTRPAPQGLQASVIETFPTFLYSVVKGLKIGKGVLECAVCLNEFEDDETLRMLPKCDHVFHPECIDAWLSSHTTCPVCRADLTEDDDQLSLTHLRETNNVSDTPETDTSSQGESDDTCAIAPQLQSSVSIRVTDDNPVRSKSRRGGIFGKFPRSHSTGHMAAARPGLAVQPGNHERFTLKLPEDVRRQILNGKLNRTTSCVVYPRQGSVSGWTGRSGSVRNINGQSGRLDPVGGKSDRWGFLRATSFLWRNNSTARKSVKKGEGSVAGWADGVGMVRSSSTRPPV